MKPSPAKIAFNTANLVGRVTRYRFKLSDWGRQHEQTVAATDEKEWERICGEIAGAGYRAVEIWEAHASPEALDRARAETWKKIMADAGLEPIGYAGRCDEPAARLCQWLGISTVNHGFPPQGIAAAAEVGRRHGLRFNLENHPQKSADEIRAQIEGGNEWIGVCIDTGWLGTKGVDVPAAVRDLGPLVRHVHLKDVLAAGGHETCPLGRGVVDVPGVIAALRDIGYEGWYSWEDEPEERNPLEIAAEMREWIEERLKDE